MKTKILGLFVVFCGLFWTINLVSASTADVLQPAGLHIIDQELQVKGTARVYSLVVGAQGYGGVTYFNGSIINDTVDDDGNNIPVTFADDVRIDGELYRTEKGGDNPVKLSDTIIPMDQYDLGSTSNRFRHGYFSGNLTVGNLLGSDIVHYGNIATTNSASSGQVLSYNGSNLVWIDQSSSGGSGDITGVTAGSGLTGGGTSGAVTLNVSGVTSSMITNNTIREVDLNISNSPTAGQYLSYNSSNQLVWSDVSSSSGDITAVTAGSGLTGGGTSGSVTLTVSGVTSSMITDGTIVAADIATNAVDSAEIAADAVESSEIAANAVGASEIAADAVYSAEIAADAVKSRHIDTLDETLTVSVSSGHGISSTTSANGSYGLYGVANHASGGTGVYGLASGTDSYGIRGSSSGASGFGIYGSATADGATDTNAGGYFVVGGGTGYGVYGNADVTVGSGTANYGGYFSADGTSGRGVYGVASATGASDVNYGGYFESSGGKSYGIYVRAHDDTGENFGGYFITDSPNGYSGHFEGGSFNVDLSGANSNFVIDTDPLGGGVSINETGAAPEENIALDVNGLIKMQNSSAPPTGCIVAVEGSMYYDTDIDEACYCAASNWRAFDGVGDCS